jgi:hypothetical protein
MNNAAATPHPSVCAMTYLSAILDSYSFSSLSHIIHATFNIMTGHLLVAFTGWHPSGFVHAKQKHIYEGLSTIITGIRVLQ